MLCTGLPLKRRVSPWGSFGVSGHLHTQRCHDRRASERASEQESTAAVALNDMAVWSHSCHPPRAFHTSRHADFGLELEWKAPDGWYESDQTATSMSKPCAMRDGRLAYIARVRGREHLCERGL